LASGWLSVSFFDEHPCVDCGERDPLVLEFDHLRDKCFGIAQGFRDRNWQSILDEIAKCIVLCGNCHLIQHWDERQRKKSG